MAVKKRKNPKTKKTDRAALAEYRRSHWGKKAPRGVTELDAPDPRQAPIVALGRVVSIVYETKKGRDRELVEYEHEFEGTLPVLAYNAKKRLLILGGSYRVESRGIVG